MRFCFEGCGTVLQKGHKLGIFAPMIPNLYGDKLCGQRNTLLDQPRDVLEITVFDAVLEEGKGDHFVG